MHFFLFKMHLLNMNKSEKAPEGISSGAFSLFSKS